MGRPLTCRMAGGAVVAIAAGLIATAAPGVAADRASEPTPADLAARLDQRLPRPALPPITGGQRIPSVQEALDALVAEGAVGTVGAVQRGARHREWASGKKRIWHDAPVGAYAPFRVASNTKTMVATLVMQLVERGEWRLNDRVNDLAPGLLAHHGNITLEQLLSHTSGMPDGVTQALIAHMDEPTWDGFFAALGDPYTDREIITAALAQPWLAAPGTQFNYSNAGYVVLGQLLQRHTGRSLAALMRERIFVPSGMTKAEFATRPGMPSAALHDAAFTKWRWYSLKNFNPALFSAAGATVASSRDMVKFANALNNGRLVRKATLANMRTPRTPDGYGLGMYRIPDPCRPGRLVYGHDGLSFGTASYALSSADGTRQVVIGLTGRAYVNGVRPIPWDVNTPLLALFAETC